MNLNGELLEKAKKAKNPEELLSMAKENSVELTNDEAKTYFARLNPKEGELNDDDLDDVSGGCNTTYLYGTPVVTAFNTCEYYTAEGSNHLITPNGGSCTGCAWSEYDGFFLRCHCPERREK